MEIHFVNAGCGNMTLLLYPNRTTRLYDCNLTGDNKKDTIAYLKKALGQRRGFNAFVCSHGDADHMRGIKIVHETFPASGPRKFISVKSFISSN